ncbi:MAG TPA: hypothetical protein VHP36_10605 [Chitinispirillaceae bacterium]|nr:hypothetical protein [Chitinispirillaceae bacterium]
MNKIVISMIILSVATSSFSLTFSKHYIVTGSDNHANSDTLTMYNNSNEIITIDTIFEEVKINGKRSHDYAEISFQKKAGTDSLYYYYDWIRSINDSVFFTVLKFKEQKLVIKANDSVSFHNFIFGTCIWCVKTQDAPISNMDTFDITLRFKYHNTTTDSIVLHGPGSFFYSNIILPGCSSKANIKNQNTCFDLLGRMYKEIYLKNSLRIFKRSSKQRNSLLLNN